MANRPRYANNHLTYPTTDAYGQQPWPKGHATRTTFNLGQKATLREQPSTFNLLTFNLLTFNLGQKATLREQPSTF
ncbi:hypothetical protein [Moorena sp. SIOASIH]|uniref:hypothetical protein n=1 Tax=Moorena sp. SIOASIH TaxID=2607817 RepID=UPI0025DD6F6C|nr:hypothetical protein [Moorena sp. SIOASIH]